MSQNGYTGCNVFPVYDTAALPQDDLRPAGLRRGYVALRSFHTLSASCVTVHGMLRYGPLGRGLGAQASCDWLIAVCGKWLNDNVCENFESKFIEFRVHAHLSCLSRRPKSNVFPCTRHRRLYLKMISDPLVYGVRLCRRPSAASRAGAVNSCRTDGASTPAVRRGTAPQSTSPPTSD